MAILRIQNHEFKNAVNTNIYFILSFIKQAFFSWCFYSNFMKMAKSNSFWEWFSVKYEKIMELIFHWKNHPGWNISCLYTKHWLNDKEKTLSKKPKKWKDYLISTYKQYKKCHWNNRLISVFLFCFFSLV